MASDTQSLNERLVAQKAVWDAKPTLQAIYGDFHRRLEAACPPGKLLDIGGGSAHFKTYRPSVVSLDIQPFPGIDVVADAHKMPFPDGEFAGIVMLDVLHHLQQPVVFLREAARVLRSGGRLAMIEPGMSTISKHFYSRFHHEPVIMSADPFAEEVNQSGDNPWDSNQAIPTLMFASPSARAECEQLVPELKITAVRWLSLVAYPLSGGFKPWCLFPRSLVNPVLGVEDAILRIGGPLMGFRLMVVLERR